MVQTSEHHIQTDIDSGLSLAEFIDALFIKWWLVLGLSAVGLALGLGAASFVPKRWDAVALVQIGQVGQLTPISNESGTSNKPPSLTFPIESSAQAAERIRDRAFLMEILEFRKLRNESDPERDPEARLIRNSLRVSIPRGTELLEIHIAGYSPEVARSNAAAVLSVLGRAHLRIMEPSIVRLRSQHQAVESKLVESVKEKARLETVFSALRGASKQISESVLTSFLISLKQREIHELTERKLHIEEQLSPARTFPSAVLTEIFVPAAPSFPSRLIFGVVGGGVGLITAFMWILLARVRRRERELVSRDVSAF
jgi:hypothetical protein